MAVNALMVQYFAESNDPDYGAPRHRNWNDKLFSPFAERYYMAVLEFTNTSVKMRMATYEYVNRKRRGAA